LSNDGSNGITSIFIYLFSQLHTAVGAVLKRQLHKEYKLLWLQVINKICESVAVLESDDSES